MMSRKAHVPVFFLALQTLVPTSDAWTFSTTNINLISPPPLNVETVVQNGTVSPNDPSYVTGWPCLNFPVPENVQRTPYPVLGGRLSFYTTNTTVGSLSNFWYGVGIFLGQISLGDGTYTTASQAPGGQNFGYYGVDTPTYKDFGTGLQCSDSEYWNISDVISSALERPVTPEQLVGINATFGVRFALYESEFDGVGVPPMTSSAYEVMDQCGYITFTDANLSEDPAAGPCNGNAVVSSSTISAAPIPITTSSSSIFPVMPHSTAFSTHTMPFLNPTVVSFTPTNTPVSSLSSHKVAIGAGVGVSMGVGILILIAAFFLLRRRKSRRHTGTVGADVMVSRPLDGTGEKSEKGRVEKGKGKDEQSGAESIHSEPLPLYSQPAENTKDKKLGIDEGVMEV